MAESYEKSKKIATKTILILAAVTVVEVLLALLGKGYLISGFHMSLLIIGGFMIILSAFKAYMIVYEFMHMKYEVPGLRKTVLLPTLLLSWALIAFLWEGSKWGDRRDDGYTMKESEIIKVDEDTHDTSHDFHDEIEQKEDGEHSDDHHDSH
jgi:cytochrome c oxidase subunit IV